MADDVEKKMREAAANLEFEKAAALREELLDLRKQLGENESLLFQGKAPGTSSASSANVGLDIVSIQVVFV